MQFVLLALAAAIGAALIVGGVVAYRGTRRTGVRAMAAAAIAAGVVTWVIVLAVVPTSRTDSGSPEPEIEAGGNGQASVAGSIVPGLRLTFEGHEYMGVEILKGGGRT